MNSGYLFPILRRRLPGISGRKKTMQFSNFDSPMSIDEYIEAHISPEHPYLQQLYRATQTHLLYPRMASGHAQGALLTMICRTVKPQRVLEIGTYSGYATLAMAAGMEQGTHIRTLEVNDEQEVFTKPWLDNSPFPPEIEMIVCNAKEFLGKDTDTYDLIFVDGNKREYCDYYRQLLPRLNGGGLLLADNTLWSGHVLEQTDEASAQTRGIQDFNDLVAQDDSVEKIILPIRDGLTIIYKKP